MSETDLARSWWGLMPDGGPALMLPRGGEALMPELNENEGRVPLTVLSARDLS